VMFDFRLGRGRDGPKEVHCCPAIASVVAVN
jgi:hypothetical protein